MVYERKTQTYHKTMKKKSCNDSVSTVLQTVNVNVKLRMNDHLTKAKGKLVTAGHKMVKQPLKYTGHKNWEWQVSTFLYIKKPPTTDI